jgi:hypothetical protein
VPLRRGTGPVAVLLVVFALRGEVPGEVGDLPVEVGQAGHGGGALGQGAADRGDHGGELGALPVQLGVVGGLAGVELGQLLAGGGELVQDRGGRVCCHAQLHGKDRSSRPAPQPGGG